MPAAVVYQSKEFQNDCLIAVVGIQAGLVSTTPWISDSEQRGFLKTWYQKRPHRTISRFESHFGDYLLEDFDSIIELVAIWPAVQRLEWLSAFFLFLCSFLDLRWLSR